MQTDATSFKFLLEQQDKHTQARLGVIHTPHGDISTPAFVPVGTQATVKSLTPDELNTLGVQLFFVNTYHCYLRPGIDVIQKAGGLHRFMGWERPLITDSGGFQLFSLARGKFSPRFETDAQQGFVKINDAGVTFRSHWDGSLHTFTAEKSIGIQHRMGADIILAFDDCTPYPCSPGRARLSLSRTHHWALTSLEVHQRLRISQRELGCPPPALYGVVQGSVFKDLRRESAKFISSLDFDGIAIGGVAVGETKTEMAKVLRWVSPLLPSGKPRHLLGVGEIDDIFVLIEHGIDTFDCVQPTRLARMGHLYTSSKLKISAKGGPASGWKSEKFTYDITKNSYKSDIRSIDDGCKCYTCTHFSRAYLHHLFRVRELLAYRLATLHNLWFVNELLEQIRQALRHGHFLEFKHAWLYNKE